MTLLKNVFDCKKMIKKEQILGDLPNNKSLYEKVFKIAWPSTLETILISLIGAADMIMVGGLGAGAIAAVGITTQPKFILLALIMSINMAVTVIVSRRTGEKDQESARKTLKQALILNVGFSTLLSLLGFMFANPMLRIAGANSEYIDLAVVYFRYIVIGNFFSGISLTLNAAQRGAGNTKISMVTNVTANVVNVIFNFLLINGIGFFPKLGVEGAAIATMMGNIIAAIISIVNIVNKNEFLYTSFKQDWSFDKKIFKEIYKISSPTFVEQSFIRLGFFIFSATIASLGTIAFAAHQVCMNILSISFSVSDGLSIANSSLVGQSLGEKRADLAMIYSKISFLAGVIIAIPIVIAVFIFREAIVSLFTDDVDVIIVSSIIMYIVGAVIAFQIPQVILIGSLRGAGDVRFVAMIMVISVTIVRPFLAWLLCYPLNLGIYGAWSAIISDQVLRLVVSYYRVQKGDWLKIAI